MLAPQRDRVAARMFQRLHRPKCHCFRSEDFNYKGTQYRIVTYGSMNPNRLEDLRDGGEATRVTVTLYELCQRSVASVHVALRRSDALG